MGLTSGITGGVTVTLSLAYLAVLAHRRNREAQSDILRAQSYVLTSLARDQTGAAVASSTASAQRAAAAPPSAYTRTELAAQQRAHFVETAKDRWNAEIEGAVRWAQNKDWAEVREGVEGAAARLFGAATATASDTAEQAQHGARVTKDAAVHAARDAGAAVRDGAHTGAEEAKGLLSRGLDKAKEAVGLAEQKATAVTREAKMSPASLLVNDGSSVNKALNQRYQKSDAMNKTVSEVLDERYKPLDARDNTKLRGI